MGKSIPLSVPSLSGRELEYVTEAIKSEWVSTGGAYITELENKIAAYVGTEQAVACQSGTAGLHLALIACGIKSGEEVIVPTLTFIAAVNPVKYVGAAPIFMDCDDTLTMDADKLDEFCQKECYIENGHLINKKTRKMVSAVIVVHVFGNMANMKRIMEIAAKYHLKVIEDATEALGSCDANGKFAGTIGDIGVYSFNGNKIITTGGGGMIVSHNNTLLKRCRHLSTQAKADAVYFDHDDIGYNYRMTNLQAALGLAQLEQIDGFIETKKENYMHYHTCGIPLLPFREEIHPNYWFYSYKTKMRDGLIKGLREKGIQARPIWKLIHTLPMYEKNQTYKIETAAAYYEQVVNIPCSSNLTREDVEYVANAILTIESASTTERDN